MHFRLNTLLSTFPGKIKCGRLFFSVVVAMLLIAMIYLSISGGFLYSSCGASGAAQAVPASYGPSVTRQILFLRA